MNVQLGMLLRSVIWSLERFVAQIIEMPSKTEGFPANWVTPPTTGIAVVAVERLRQQLVEGYSVLHDGKHRNAQLTQAAAETLLGAFQRQTNADWLLQTAERRNPPFPWWGFQYQMEGKDTARLLSIGAALAIAELDRLLRLNHAYICDNCAQARDVELSTGLSGEPVITTGPVTDAALLLPNERYLCPRCAAQRTPRQLLEPA